MYDRFQSRLTPVVACVVALALFLALAAFFPALSTIGAGAFLLALGVGGFVAIDAFVLKNSSTYEEVVVKKNVAYAIALLAYALIVSAAISTAQTAPPLPGDYHSSGELVDADGDRFVSSGVAHLDSVLTQVGVTERGRNSGPEVRRYLRSVGLGPGYAWCAALTSWGLEVAGVDGPHRRDGTVIRTAGARVFNEAVSTVSASRVVRMGVRVPPGSVATWRRGSGWQGHSGYVLRDDNARQRGLPWYARCGLTVEGNTSSGRRGSQRDGDGVYRRVRCIEPLSYFRITDFTLV